MGQKARPVACGDILRRVIGAVFCHRYYKKLTDYFRPCGQYGVVVSGGVETMALIATLGFEEGCTILSYDGANAFNSIYRPRLLPALTKIIPSQWYPMSWRTTHDGNMWLYCRFHTTLAILLEVHVMIQSSPAKHPTTMA